jgi:hypothetical protein
VAFGIDAYREAGIGVAHQDAVDRSAHLDRERKAGWQARRFVPADVYS